MPYDPVEVVPKCLGSLDYWPSLGDIRLYGLSPFFGSLSALHCASEFLITVFHEMLTVVMPCPVVS